ncbi:MAG: hypothetical protein KJO07_23035 [Deltaproteobacteria bacterium]|nr:hypothetical protein [Deltaproteobacteria bacterium]
MVRLLLALILVGGCGFDSAINVVAVDGGDNPVPGCAQWQERLFFDPCVLSDPGDATLDLSNPGQYLFNSSARALVGPDLEPIAVDTVVIDSTDPALVVLNVGGLSVGRFAELRLEGNRPVVIASWSSIAVAGIVSARSSYGDGLGAGANTGSCSELGMPQLGPNGGGGGGGAGFGGPGGDGGSGSDGAAAGATGGAGFSTSILRGGCPGGDGADVGEGAVGTGGAGGGALLLLATTSISISGTIHAGGQAGRGATRPNGGGGAGSGGMIGLVAPLVDLTEDVVLASNGGGGGEGGNADSSMGGTGSSGRSDGQVAAGGSGLSEAGNGGSGSTGTSAPGTGDTRFYSGGGSGGGVGFVVVKAQTFEPAGAYISPPPSEL